MECAILDKVVRKHLSEETFEPELSEGACHVRIWVTSDECSRQCEENEKTLSQKRARCVQGAKRKPVWMKQGS